MSDVRRQSWLSIGGRVMIMICVLMALVGISLPGSRAPADLTILVDDSLSMPAGFSDALWPELSGLSHSLPAGSTVRLLRFAGDVVAEPMADSASLPRTALLEAGATDISRALRYALDQMPARRDNQSLLLLSDAVATHGDTDQALSGLARAGVDSYLLAPPLVSGAREARLLALRAPVRVNRASAFGVRASLRGEPGSSEQLTLLVDGMAYRQQRVQLPQIAGAAAVDVERAFTLTLAQPGMVELSVRIDDSETLRARPAQQLTRVVTVEDQGQLLLISAQPYTERLTEQLRHLGMTVAVVAPAELSARLQLLRSAALIVLDNVGIAELDEYVWELLAEQVTQRGSGLLVLGGEHSFGGGAYRHSRLEALLPVTAEAAEPEQRAAVVFLLDASGSMQQARGAYVRYALARQAVTLAAQQLAPGDLVGITTFAEQVDVRRVLAPLGSGAEAISAVLAQPAGGATRLAPALHSAIEQLRRVDIQQRIVVLVTDGFASDEGVAEVIAQLNAAQITVIALAVGDQPSMALLERLAQVNHGQVMAVNDIATLPRLMSAAVASQRAPKVVQPTPVWAAQQAPFLAPDKLSWPALDGYMVTRLRPGAELYLQSESGDPLLAAGFSGVGRVVVLPGGLGGEWSEAWLRWPALDEVVGRMLRWMAPGSGGGELWLSLRERMGQLEVIADQRASGQWSMQVPRLQLQEPTGGSTAVQMHMLAPGRYRALYSLRRPGLHVATLSGQRQTIRRGFYYNMGRRESVDVDEAASVRNQWRQLGLIKDWNGVDDFLAALPPAPVAVSMPLLLISLCGYVLLQLWERGLLSRWARFRTSSPAIQ